MIVEHANDFVRALEDNNLPADSPCVPRGLLMVEPEGFYVGMETALDNHYMDLTNAADPDRAVRLVIGSMRCMVAKIF